MLPAVLVALSAAAFVAAPAGAVMYAFRRPMRRHWRVAPDWWIISRVIKDHRKRGSIFFLIVWAHFRAPKKPGKATANWNREMLLKMGLNAEEIRQLRGIYRGLEPELGTFQAVVCCVEIIRALKENGR